MRELLKEQHGVRGVFQGQVDRFGAKRAFRGPDQMTLMLKDVKDASGVIVADHLWMVVGARLQALSPQIGDEIVFEARVTEYEKGYKGYREDAYSPISIDYRLSNPTKIRKVEKGA